MMIFKRCPKHGEVFQQMTTDDNPADLMTKA